MASLKDVREQIAALMPAKKTGTFDYLMGCHHINASNQIEILAGTSSGNGAAFPMTLANGGQWTLQPARLSLDNGHSSVPFLYLFALLLSVHDNDNGSGVQICKFVHHRNEVSLKSRAGEEMR